jgi:hypothetical protein
VWRAHLALMERTAHTIALFLAPLSRETATTLRDGGAGWTVAEVLGHLRDFDGYFRGRAIIMIAQHPPLLPGYDPDAIAVAACYNEQDPHMEQLAKILHPRG